MSPKRFFYIMVTSTILMIGLIVGGAVGGNMLIQKQSKRLTDLKAENIAIEAQQVSLIQAKKDIEKYTELDSIAKTIVPQDKDQAKTVREINTIAASSGVTLKQITFPSSNLGQATPAAPKTTDTGSSTTTPAAPPISQVKPVDGIQGVYSLEIQVSSDEKHPGSYYNLLQFLSKLEANRRTAHVQKITISPVKNSSGLSFTLTLNAYVKP